MLLLKLMEKITQKIKKFAFNIITFQKISQFTANYRRISAFPR